MNQADLQAHYFEEKAKLNPAQREAVESIEGPVMVLAGPGTGKTQVLAFRIAEILQQTDSSPRNILALTFTESGVAAMRERLVSLIGVAAYGVGIYTFHSFTNRIINDSGAEFYKTHSLDPIDEITQLKLVLLLIDELQSDLLRPVRAPYFYAKPVIATIKKLKNEGVSPQELGRLCQEAIDDLAASPGSLSKSGKNKGEIKQSVKDRIKQFERTRELAMLYARYEEELAVRGLYDYEDMILFIINHFRDNTDLKAKYQEQFHYVLVDEYQDTNNAQNTLIRLLADYFDTPNLFVVGDDKQSIYRFQGASITNLLNFLEWYPQAKRISLTENYRSGQVILDNVHTLISRNQEQLASVLPDLANELHAQDSGGLVAYTQYATADKEALGIVQQMKELIGSGVPPSEIALLYRENSEAHIFADLLSREGIAYHQESGSDLLKDGDVRQLITLLELAREPDNEQALFRFLHAPYSQVDTTDLIVLGRRRKEGRTTWQGLSKDPAQLESLPESARNALMQSGSRVEGWYRYAQNHNIGDTIEHIFLTSGLLEHLMAQNDRLDRLHRMRNFFKEIDHVKTSVPFASLDDLFERLQIRRTYNIALMCPPAADKIGEAVRLMTAHKSKGLEFSYVFIPHVHDGKWGNAGRSESIVLPEGIVAHHKVSDDSQIEEERRLFYVALTRAKQGAFLSSAELDDKQARCVVSQFVSELSQVQIVAPRETELLPLHTFFSPVDARFVTETSQNYLREIVANQALSPTGLNTYLMCPMEYLYKEVYCIPGVREPFQSYGTAIHKALEVWGKLAKESGEPVPLNTLLSVFREALVKEGLTQSEVARYEKLGVDVLSGYYDQFAARWREPLAVEYSFAPHAVKLDGIVPLNGKIDKIERIPGTDFVEIIDFKTGRVHTRNEILGLTAANDQDYYRQVVFYSVLAEADPSFPYKIGQTTLAFIDDRMRFTEETFEITKAEKDNLRQLIRSVWGEINQLHFDHTPHKKQWGQDESLCDLLRGESQSSPMAKIPAPIVDQAASVE